MIKKLKTLLITLALTMLTICAFALPASAEIGSKYDDYLYCKPDMISETVTITDCDTSASGEIVIPSEIGGLRVTAIGEDAFVGCNNLESVVIPEGVTIISPRAFDGCSGLKKVVLPQSLQKITTLAFRNCTQLNNITIPTNVIGIYTYAFSGCTSLTNITIPGSAGTIYNNAFEGCNALESVTISEGIAVIETSAFNGCTKLKNLNLPNSLTTIEDRAFADCLSLENITIPKKIAVIGNDVFLNCSNIKTLNFNVTAQIRILGSSISQISTLETINIGDGVTEIPSSLFKNCANIKSVSIPKSVKTIGKSAFEGCTGIEKVSYQGNKLEWNKIEKSNNTALTSAEIIYENPYNVSNGIITEYTGSDTNIEIPSEIDGEKITGLGANLFKNHTNLESVTIPEGITNIGENAFEGCSALTDVYINDTMSWCKIVFKNIYSNPMKYAENLYIDGKLLENLTITDDITSIPNYAFSGCTCLTSVTIPYSVTSIGTYAFNDCGNLAEVYYNGSFSDFLKIAIGSYNDNFTSAKLISDDIIADSWGKCGDNIEYYFVKETDTLTIYGTGNMKNYSNPSSPFKDSNVKTVIIEDGVTGIASNMFNGCGGLVSVTIPESVTNIGRYAFKDCSILDLYYNAISVANDYDSGFSDCRINRIHIGDKVANIPDSAFYGSSGLSSVTIPDSVTNIGTNAFKDCTSLTSITLPDSITHIGVNAFFNTPYYNDETKWENGVLYIGKHLITANSDIPSEYTIKQGTKTIADSAFVKCTSLTSITFPPSITHVGENAFFCISNASSDGTGNSLRPYYSGHLTNVYITDLAAWCNIDFSGNENSSISSFLYCLSSNPLEHAKNLYLNGTLVTNLVIPNDVTKINDYAFTGCDNLTSITIPKGIVSIGDYAFSGCCGPTSITIPEGVTSIGKNAFDCGLTNITIPESVTSIGDYAFGYAFDLNIHVPSIDWLFKYRSLIEECSAAIIVPRSVIVPEGYETVDLQFNNCVSLESIVIPSSVTSISSKAFSGCTNIKSVYIDKSVQNIGASAFESCNKLTDVYYGGSETEWFLLPINSGNGNLLNATIHYNSDIPTVAPDVDPDQSDDTTPTPPTPTPKPEIIPTEPEVEKTEDDKNWHFEVKVEETYEDSYVYALAFDENGRLIGMNRVDLNQTEPTTVDLAKNDSVYELKIFVWTEDMQPITTVWKSDLKNDNSY